MKSASHWQTVYESQEPESVSWYEQEPAVSLRLIREAGIALDDPIIDVGGGASRLVDALLDAGFKDLTVLDIAGEALAASRNRLGEHAAKVEWIEQDVTQFRPERQYGLWHDRAMFHFLTTPDEQAAYVDTLRKSLRDGGHAIIATFAIDGPPRCSGLTVERYDAARMRKALGAEFEFVEQVDKSHQTPAGTEQQFSFFRLSRRPVLAR